MMQPSAIMAAVPKENSSAPSSAATTTWRPVMKPPSTRTRTRPRRSFSTSAAWVSASPSSHGMPACLMDDSGDAPVPAVGPAHVDDVGQRLDHPGGHRAHAVLGHELHRHLGGVDLLQVEDELGQVLDRVDVVVGRRRDQRDAGLGVAQAGDLVRHLVAGQLPALARLRALGDLDLELVGVGRVLGGDAEAPRGDLLDLRVLVALVEAAGAEPGRVLAALAAVRPGPEEVHGLGQRLVGLLGERPVRHGAGREALGDLVGRLDLVERHRAARQGTSSSRSLSSVAGRSFTSEANDS